MTNPDTLGVILAGGASSRMGTDKALVEVRGQPMYQHVTRELNSIVEKVIVVGRPSLPGLPAVTDRRGSGGGLRRGPLAGLATALESFDRRIVLVAVDQPFVRAATLQALLDVGGAAVPVDDEGIRQVTCATYPPEWREPAIAADEAGESIQLLFDRMPHHRVEPAEWRAWGEDGRSWYSVDSPDRLGAGLARYQ